MAHPSPQHNDAKKDGNEEGLTQGHRQYVFGVKSDDPFDFLNPPLLLLTIIYIVL
jgi:hypothetical protein